MVDELAQARGVEGLGAPGAWNANSVTAKLAAARQVWM